MVLKGPKHTQARTAPSQRHCDNVDDTGVCPYECSGHEPFNGQQCIVYQNLPSKVQPATVKGGVPIKENSPTLEVAVVDFYDFIVETAAEPVFVSVSVDLTELALLPAYDSQGVLTNCTQTSTWNKPDICEYNLSPVGDSRLLSGKLEIQVHFGRRGKPKPFRSLLQVKLVNIKDVFVRVTRIRQQVAAISIPRRLVQVVVLLYKALQLRLHVGHLVSREFVLVERGLGGAQVLEKP